MEEFNDLLVANLDCHAILNNHENCHCVDEHNQERDCSPHECEPTEEVKKCLEQKD